MTYGQRVFAMSRVQIEGEGLGALGFLRPVLLLPPFRVCRGLFASLRGLNSQNFVYVQRQRVWRKKMSQGNAAYKLLKK